MAFKRVLYYFHWSLQILLTILCLRACLTINESPLLFTLSLHNLGLGCFNWIDCAFEDQLALLGSINHPYTTLYSVFCFLSIYIISNLIEFMEFGPQRPSNSCPKMHRPTQTLSPIHKLLIQKSWLLRQIKILSDGLISKPDQEMKAASFEKE